MSPGLSPRGGAAIGGTPYIWIDFKETGKGMGWLDQFRQFRWQPQRRALKLNQTDTERNSERYMDWSAPLCPGQSIQAGEPRYFLMWPEMNTLKLITFGSTAGAQRLNSLKKRYAFFSREILLEAEQSRRHAQGQQE